MTSLVKRFPRNVNGKDYCVGDVHGHKTRLMKILESIGFDETKDRLFSVGDNVDRGPESEEMLELIRIAKWYHPALGNHDWMLVQHHERHAVLTDENYLKNGGAWAMALPPEIRQGYVDIVRTLPMAIEVEGRYGKIGIIHADVIGDDWDMTMGTLENHPNIVYPFHMHFMWDRYRILHEVEYEVQGVYKLVVGHTPVKQPLRLANVLAIDTGGWRTFEQSPKLAFTLYNITDDEVMFIEFDKDM